MFPYVSVIMLDFFILIIAARPFEVARFAI